MRIYRSILLSSADIKTVQNRKRNISKKSVANHIWKGVSRSGSMNVKLYRTVARTAPRKEQQKIMLWIGFEM